MNTKDSNEKNSVMVPTLLLILTILLAITWGVPHEQRNLQSRAIARLAATEADAENYQIRFSGRDAYVYGKNISADAASRISDKIGSIPGVRKVHYLSDSAKSEADSDDGTAVSTIASTANNTEETTALDIASDSPESEAQVSSANTQENDDPAPAVAETELSEQDASDDSSATDQLQYQLDSFLLHGELLFPPGSLMWTPLMQQTLIETAGFLKYNPGLKIEIAGFSEPVGDAVFARQLSEQRAQQVLAYLVYMGIDASRLVSNGYGFDRQKLGSLTTPTSIRFIVQGDLE